MYHPELYPWQLDALERMHVGCILWGGTGCGKTITAIAYYYCLQAFAAKEEDYQRPLGSEAIDLLEAEPLPFGDALIVITTPKKRNDGDWQKEIQLFDFSTAWGDDHERWFSKSSFVTVDSWNNIEKYKNRKAFFIFDEQRTCSYKTWGQTFVHIARSGNPWIMLSATPGDSWEDYAAVFVANGFYRGKTDFYNQHAIYDKWNPYKPAHWRHVGILEKHRDDILVEVKYAPPAEEHHIYICCPYNKEAYKYVCTHRKKWNILENKPAGEIIRNKVVLGQHLREIVNNNIHRLGRVDGILQEHRRVIIFYNFNYELELLKNFLESRGGIETIAEYNGKVKDPIPETFTWVYLVNYGANEAWNCITCDTIIFFSQNYSYRVMIQAAGRINRCNTLFKDLYYFHIVTASPIDKGIQLALEKKKDFNEGKFFKWFDE